METLFQLEPPTMADLAMRAAKSDAVQKIRARIEAAPPPEEFTLSGSNRAADLAVAQGQMELGAPVIVQDCTITTDPVKVQSCTISPRTRVSSKLLESLKGTVVRLTPRDGVSWNPHGVLCGFDAHTYTLETLSRGRLLAFVEPRDEFSGIEEIDTDPDAYRKHGLPKEMT